MLYMSDTNDMKQLTKLLRKQELLQNYLLFFITKIFYRPLTLFNTGSNNIIKPQQGSE